MLYKDPEKFLGEVNNIPIRYTTKTSLVTKIKQAIEYKIPTVALALYNIAKNINEAVINPKLQKTLNICKEPTDAIFLRRAFGEPNETTITQLGELYYYLCKIGEPDNVITDTILARFGEIEDLKYSDFLNLAMVLKGDKLIKDIRNQLDIFSGVVIYEYLLKYAEEISSSGVFPEDFKTQYKQRYKYFAEGIKKWAFLDRNVKKPLKEDVRSLALKTNYKYITILGNDIMLKKLVELSKYTSNCYLTLIHDNGYKFHF